MHTIHFESIRSILCLGAHADDIESGCGGMVLKLLEENPGIEVHWVVFSAAGERRGEAQRTAEFFLAGAAGRTIEIENFRDASFPYQGQELKDRFLRLEKEVRPDLIFTHRRADRHQDHRFLAELTWNAFRNHVILEYEIPKYEGDLGAPNFFVPLSETNAQKKVNGLMQGFPTQTARSWFTEDLFWSLMRIRGIECHSPTRYAEGFTASKLTLGRKG